MANRHISRSIVLQTLYEMDFRDYTQGDGTEIADRDALEFADEVLDANFTKNLLQGVMSKKSEVDLIITKAAPDWPLDKISIIDRNILRLGLYELIFGNPKEVPAKVAINEAIELAKSYGGEKSSKFINGVLGAVYKELGEPDKDAVSKRKSKLNQNIPFDKMPIQRLGGAVVYARQGNDYYLAFVHDVFGYWTLSKGKLLADDDIKEGTKREIKKEIGLDIEIIEEVGNNEYIANHPEDGKIRKQVVYFLAKSPYQELILEKDGGGLDQAKWFRLSEVEDMHTYGDILPFVTKAIKLISEKEK